MVTDVDVDTWLKRMKIEYEKTKNDKENSITWSFQRGSATIFCQMSGLEPTRNLFAYSTVLVNAELVPDTNRIKFYEYLLEVNAKNWNFVKFVLTSDKQVQLRWGMLARHCDADEFVLGIAQLSKAADYYDDDLKKFF